MLATVADSLRALASGEGAELAFPMGGLAAMVAFILLIAFWAGRRWERRQAHLESITVGKVIDRADEATLLRLAERAARRDASRRISAAFDELPEIRTEMTVPTLDRGAIGLR